MNSVCAPFEGKKITVLGLGLLGRAVGDVEFLARCAAQVLVTDQKTESELEESVERLKGFSNVSFHLGGHDEKDFIGCDMVIKAAGVPLESPYVAAARKAGIPVYMSTALFAKYALEAGATLIAVTGTRGKSTTTQMIYEVLKAAGKKVLLGGNIRGVSTLALLPEVSSDTIVVLELDSWQLQGFGDLEISPQIAIFTNLMADHQNYYKDEAQYFADKANIFRHQKAGDTLILGESIVERVRQINPIGKLLIPGPLADDWHLKIPGDHNRRNAALAVAALHVAGLSESAVRAGIESFQGVEGRLQLVGEVNGVKIYNDNNATTPDATVAALRALAPNDGFRKSIILIMGGADKGLDMSVLLSEAKPRAKKVILLAGTGTDRIKGGLPDAVAFDSLKEAVESAFASAEPGESILFSPAFASFGMFKNEYERNDDFMQIVGRLRGGENEKSTPRRA